MAQRILPQEANIRLFLLGMFRVERDGAVVPITFQKQQSLFAYLALHPEEHAREKIATLLWGDSTDQRARNSLRVALTALRQRLGSDLILSDRETVQINPDALLWVDGLALQTESEAQDNGSGAALSTNSSFFPLDYPGDLLADSYEEWVLQEREPLRQHYIAALLTQVGRARAASDYPRATELAQLVLKLERANERAHQHLMFLYAVQGERNAALAQYAESPGDLLTRLDRFLGTSGTTDFATVSYGVLDPATGVFEYSSAGHPPILLVSPEGETRWLDEAQSPPLCGDDERRRPDAKVILEPTSLLVFYSDGLIERRGELLNDRLDRLKNAGSSLVGLPIADVGDYLVVALGVDTSREDDVAVLAVHFNPLARGGFHLVFPAEPSELRNLRASMRDWLDERHVGPADQDALVLATGEACSNAIEHSYSGRTAGEV